jgi:hypothetical protein
MIAPPILIYWLETAKFSPPASPLARFAERYHPNQAATVHTK